MKCRHCKSELTQEFIDLVNAPAPNSFLTKEQLNEPEVFYPLRLLVCRECWLVQVDEYKKSNDIFNKDYAYFSSYSKSWLEHARKYVDMIVDRFGFDESSQVMEIASNDGYLLQNFVKKNIPCLGIEPSSNTAQVARKIGIETKEDFFSFQFAQMLAAESRKADLIVGNNVFAHVPNVNDFVAGLKVALKDKGIVTLEFPHLMRLIADNQFDTVYHEHFSYYSFYTVKRIFEKQGLDLFDVEQLFTHGGSLRVYAKHKEDSSKDISDNVSALLKEEELKGMLSLDYYKGFQVKVDTVKYNFVNFLLEQKRLGHKVAAYGAAAKGNTLLNYCGVKNDLIKFVVDASPHKQGKYLPGSHIPVVKNDEIKKYKPDYVFILPWNLKDEIAAQLDYIREWGGKFVVPIPEIKVF